MQAIGLDSARASLDAVLHFLGGGPLHASARGIVACTLVVAHLQQWCQRAEASGIRALRDLSLRLHAPVGEVR